MSTGEGSLEIERKYAVGAGFELPDLSGVTGVAVVTGPRTYQLTAIYLDTPGLDLAAAPHRRDRRGLAPETAGRRRRPPRGARPARARHRDRAGPPRRAGGAMGPRPAAAPDRPAADRPHGAPAHRCRRRRAG